MMQDLCKRYGSWGLVAGAAEGLGASYARILASSGMNLILVDQKKELLEKQTIHLRSSFGIQVIPIHQDLAGADSVEKILKVIGETSCRFIIYNAAYSEIRKFMQNERHMLERYVQVNVRNPLQLVFGFCHLHGKIPDQHKGIILMSSLAGSWGTQLLGPYGGSKAFLQNLAESLHFELKAEGFDFLACIAGPVATPGYLASLPQDRKRALSAMSPDKVAQSTLRALGKRSFVIPGFRNKLNYFLLSRILPRRWSLRIMNRAVGKLYREKI